MDMSYDSVLPRWGGYFDLTSVEKINSGVHSNRVFTDPHNTNNARHHPTFLPLRQHMLVSLFCGEYPLEMRESRRPKDAW
jgi:hypothetical protein